ncbi:MAG TPA: flagellar M-ring protein FliF C-terminal domain-containing protein, partial [Gemmata sp.]
AERSMNSTSTGGRAGGIAGATSNITRAGGAATTTSGSSGAAKEEVIQTDYLVSETLRDIEEGTGAVSRLSVAALVDLTPQSEGQAVISQADVEEIIKQAVGFRSGRDNVTIARAPLSGPEAAVPDDTLVRLQKFQTYVSLARNLSVAVATVLVFLVIGLLVLRRGGRGAADAPRSETAAGTADAAAGTAGAAPTGPTPPPTQEERRTAELAKFQALARNEPGNVATVFNVMLGEQSI